MHVHTAAPAPSPAAWRAAAAAAVGVLADVVFDPQARHVPLCPFRAATGLQCPLCGSLRAVDAAVHGHAAAAWHDNALLWLLLPALIAYWAGWVRRGSAPAVPRWAVGTLAGLALVFTVLRNAFPALGLLPG